MHGSAISNYTIAKISVAVGYIATGLLAKTHNKKEIVRLLLELGTGYWQ